MKSKPQVNGSVTLNGVVGNIPRELPAQEDRGAAETLAPDADATKNGTQYSAPAMEQATVDLVAIPVDGNAMTQFGAADQTKQAEIEVDPSATIDVPSGVLDGLLSGSAVSSQKVSRSNKESGLKVVPSTIGSMIGKDRKSVV